MLTEVEVCQTPERGRWWYKVVWNGSEIRGGSYPTEQDAYTAIAIAVGEHGESMPDPVKPVDVWAESIGMMLP